MGSSEEGRVWKIIQKKRSWLGLIFLGLAGSYFFCLPEPLFSDPYSTVLEDREGRLLSARIADDGQWRFPAGGGIPEKMRRAILQFEDRDFESHIGVDFSAIARAALQNWKAGKVVSGASTLSMQLIRLSRKGKKRSYLEKIVEMILASRLELSYSKQEILKMYLAHAPFGGNVVGLDAASWRYFSRAPQDLSWGETCALAVLPNAPSLIYPGKNQQRLLNKRNRLLKALLKAGVMDEQSAGLAMEEGLPGRPRPLPDWAPHLLLSAQNQGQGGKRISTSIDLGLQRKLRQKVHAHSNRLARNEIYNAAALVIDVESGACLAYVGNGPDRKGLHGSQVDVIRAPRSPGSLLKPLLYASALMEGEILPQSLMADIPTRIGGYSPKNFNQKYDGAVPAGDALVRSLNIPFVRLLYSYGQERFYHRLKKLKLSTLNHPAEHYGLSLILGGAEVNLWEMAGVYASMGRALNHYQELNGMYAEGDYRAPHYLLSDSGAGEKEISKYGTFDASSIWSTFEMLKNLSRPEKEKGWEQYASASKMAWKTGTSFGFRDAWAIGLNSKYLIGVWVGNADGEGRPGLTGLSAAAPLLFELSRILPGKQGWFSPPYDELSSIPICSKSGFRALVGCPEQDSLPVPLGGLKSPACSFHRRIHLESSGKYRVNSSCYPVDQMRAEDWFVLPPVQEWYYKRKDPFYRALPPYDPACRGGGEKNMELIFPQGLSNIFIPVELDGSPGRVVFELSHRHAEKTVYWHLDGEFIGSTRGFHQQSLNPSAGWHSLSLVDEEGQFLEKRFRIRKS